MTKSTGQRGLIFWTSPPIFTIASRIAARSTTAGTPVKSCNKTRAGRKAISLLLVEVPFHLAAALTSSSETVRPSSYRNKFSRRTFIEKGNREILPKPFFSAA